MLRRYPNIGIMVLVVVFFSLDVGLAQTPGVSRSQDASVISEKLKREEEDTEKRPKRPAPVILEEEEQLPVVKGETPFRVRRIRLEGNTWISQADFGPILERYEGKEKTLSELKALTRAIEREYRQKGFIATYAYLPPQKVSDGQLVVRVIEGRIGNVYVEGNRWFRKKRVLAYSKLRPGEALRYGDLADSIYRLNRNPDRDTRLVLRQGATPGTTDAVYMVKDRFPVHAGFSFDDEGNRPTGLKRYGFSLKDNNTLGLDDTNLAGFMFGSHFGIVYDQYSVPIPQTGTVLTGWFSHAQVAPKKEFKPYGVNGTAEIYSIRADQELWSFSLFSFSCRLGMDLGFAFKEDRTKMLSGTFKRDRLRILTAGPTVSLLDRWGSTVLASEFAVGLDTLGAMVYTDPQAARQGVKPRFFAWRMNGTRYQPAPFGTKLQGRFGLQVSGEKMPSSEALYLGGASTVRGYPEGDYLADSGYFISIDHLTPLFFAPSEVRLPFSNMALRDQVQIVVFTDYGYGMLRGSSNLEVHSRTLLGAGGGLRVQLWRNFYARLEWAQPLGAPPLTGCDKNRFHFRLQAEI